MKLIYKLLRTFLFVSGVAWISISADAQFEQADLLMQQAIEFAKLKEYERSNDCYRKFLEEIRPYDNGQLSPKIRGMMALNYLNIGVASLKRNDFDESKYMLELAISHAADDPKVLATAYSWMGQWHSIQTFSYISGDENLKKMLDYSRKAEHFFNLAEKKDKVLSQKIKTAELLVETGETEHARQIFNEVIEQCDNAETLSIMAKALAGLGNLESYLEEYQGAIAHLERAYEIAVEVNPTYSTVPANSLVSIFTYKIPDPDKAALWKSRGN